MIPGPLFCSDLLATQQQQNAAHFLPATSHEISSSQCGLNLREPTAAKAWTNMSPAAAVGFSVRQHFDVPLTDV